MAYCHYQASRSGISIDHTMTMYLYQKQNLPSFFDRPCIFMILKLLFPVLDLPVGTTDTLL